MAILRKFSNQEKERSTIHRSGSTENFFGDSSGRRTTVNSAPSFWRTVSANFRPLYPPSASIFFNRGKQPFILSITPSAPTLSWAFASWTTTANVLQSCPTWKSTCFFLLFHYKTLNLQHWFMHENNLVESRCFLLINLLNGHINNHKLIPILR